MFLTGLALAAVNPPERWVHVGGSADSYREYLDTESVTRSGDKVSVWTRRDFAGGQATAWHELEFDCSTRTETILAYVRDDRGTVSHNVVRPHRGPAPIAPNSVEERIFDLACR
jgi:hypothetical protein